MRLWSNLPVDKHVINLRAMRTSYARAAIALVTGLVLLTSASVPSAADLESNELIAIQTCIAVGDAQHEYFSRDRDGDDILEYASVFRSSSGHHDGLFWPADEGRSPLGEFVATAAKEGYGSLDTAYRGYRYKLLAAQGPAAPGGAYGYIVGENQTGGFAVIAFPAAYGDSGIMSFMLSHAGIVYQKDLGRHTEIEALNMESFNPEDGWTKVEEKDR